MVLKHQNKIHNTIKRLMINLAPPSTSWMTVRVVMAVRRCRKAETLL